MSEAVRVGVVGASGYAGMELLRVLLRHPHARVVAATSEQRAGQPLGEALPAFRGLTDLRFEPADPAALADRIDVAMIAVPHGTSIPIIAGLRKAGVAVIDLSGEFRLRDREAHEGVYGTHAAPELMGQAVYGMPELYRDALAGADFAAAPGCYPTAMLLPLVPFLRQGRVAPDPVIVDAKSGVSGAGRKVAEEFLLAEAGESVRAYGFGGGHKHVPEMEQEAAIAAAAPVHVTFVPHLLPIVRGMASSVFVRPTREIDTAGAHALLAEAYAREPFVRVLPPGEAPRISAVRGTNFCDVSAFRDDRTGLLVLLSALDNLGKGAAGQMVQCLNVMRGYPETTGLLEAPLGP